MISSVCAWENRLDWQAHHLVLGHEHVGLDPLGAVQRQYVHRVLMPLVHVRIRNDTDFIPDINARADQSHHGGLRAGHCDPAVFHQDEATPRDPLD